MTPEEGVNTAISGEMSNRVHSFPNILVDLASKLIDTELLQVISDSELTLDVINASCGKLIECKRSV